MVLTCGHDRTTKRMSDEDDAAVAALVDLQPACGGDDVAGAGCDHLELVLAVVVAQLLCAGEVVETEAGQAVRRRSEGRAQASVRADAGPGAAGRGAAAASNVEAPLEAAATHHAHAGEGLAFKVVVVSAAAGAAELLTVWEGWGSWRVKQRTLPSRQYNVEDRRHVGIG